MFVKETETWRKWQHLQQKFTGLFKQNNKHNVMENVCEKGSKLCQVVARREQQTKTIEETLRVVLGSRKKTCANADVLDQMNHSVARFDV